MLLYHGDGAVGQLFDLPEQRFLGEVAEGDSLAATARPSGPADSVDIGLRHLGQIVVEDMGQLFDCLLYTSLHWWTRREGPPQAGR